MPRPKGYDFVVDLGPWMTPSSQWRRLKRSRVGWIKSGPYDGRKGSKGGGISGLLSSG